MTQVNKDHMLKKFTEALEEGNAALFIGAGLSKASGFVDWKELMRNIAAELGLDVERETDLIALAQYHVNKFGGRDGLNERIINEFTKDATLTENHRLIAALPVRAIWTTNYDDLLERAYRESRRQPDVKTTPENLGQTITQRDVVIYKMHGDSTQPQDAVLTKDDYETYQDKREAFSTALSWELMARTFLFLGFSFTDPNIDYILGRIRRLLGQNQRKHYCVMKWPDPPKDSAGSVQTEYEYNRRKLELRISDLSRYQIHAVMVDDYAEITEILTELNRRTHQRDIFVSGSADEFDPQFDKKRLGNFLERLGQEIIDRDFNLVSGFGPEIGPGVVLGALKRIREKSLPLDRLRLFPFPVHMPPGPDRDELFSRHRRDMISSAVGVIFVSGNNHKDAEVGLHATGVMEEFNIAQELKRVLVPVGASGYAARQIWEEVRSGASKEAQRAADQLKVLGDPERRDDDLIEAIFKLIAAVSQ